MLRASCLVLGLLLAAVVALLLAAVSAIAAPDLPPAHATQKTAVHKHVRRMRAVPRPRVRRDPAGTLPGFGRGDVYDPRTATLRSRLRRNPFAYTLPAFYRWDGSRYYPGRPGFYRGRWNGGSFGPCYTQTPIGPVYNCGQ